DPLRLQAGQEDDDGAHHRRHGKPLRPHHRPPDRPPAEPARTVRPRHGCDPQKGGGDRHGPGDQRALSAPRPERCRLPAGEGVGCQDRHLHRHPPPGESRSDGVRRRRRPAGLAGKGRRDQCLAHQEAASVPPRQEIVASHPRRW
ncbi:MAG: hypothetical protein GXP25_23135, partial [Planctomycetes bacterium]|nr:hypothetical protein [Planctomycetota bacterium]